jgi:hypothetical protein
MPSLAIRLPAGSFQFVNQVPRSHSAKLPRSLPIFRYGARSGDLSINGLQKLLDQSVFLGTNAAGLLRDHTNSEIPIRLATAQHLDYFFVDATWGTISYATHDNGVNLRTEIPPYDAVPSFDSIRDTLLRYAADFGVGTNEMEYMDDGSLFLRKTDDKTVARGGQVKFINRRSLAVSRTVAGYPLLVSSDRVEMAQGVKGRLLKFDLIWPTMRAVRTNRVFTMDKILDNIKRGGVLADEMNRYPVDGIAEVILKDLRVFYYAPQTSDIRQVLTNADIVPIVSIHAVFKSKTGKTEDGGIYTPLAEP